MAIHVSGVNFLDVYFRSGLYKSDHPVAIGSEAAGVIEAVGEGVTDLKAGDRVAYTMVRGTYAEYAVVPAINVIRIPDALTVREPPRPCCCRGRRLTTSPDPRFR